MILYHYKASFRTYFPQRIIIHRRRPSGYIETVKAVRIGYSLVPEPYSLKRQNEPQYGGYSNNHCRKPFAGAFQHALLKDRPAFSRGKFNCRQYHEHRTYSYDRYYRGRKKSRHKKEHRRYAVNPCTDNIFFVHCPRRRDTRCNSKKRAVKYGTVGKSA